MLEKMKGWLQTFPGWEDTLCVDYTDGVPGSSGLYPRGVTEISRWEDVLGNVAVRCRCVFTLRRSACPSEDNARWLLDLQQWVMEQNRLGLVPQFGDDPRQERIRAYEGRLDKSFQTGSGLYTVQLSAEFTKLYEVK
jgi:hypothetical protein